MADLGRIVATRKSGQEPITYRGEPIGPKLADFWGWSRSDLVENIARGVFAEFLVATALGVSVDGARDGCAAFDLVAPDGTKVEVKSSAYLQSWHQDAMSKISFSTKSSHAYDADTNTVADEKKRQADVYVFCLLAHTDKATVDPLCLDQWRFYVLPTLELDGRTRSQYSITLKSLEEMTHAIQYEGLKEAVLRAAPQMKDRNSPLPLEGR
jgi:hypothetical protein